VAASEGVAEWALLAVSVLAALHSTSNKGRMICFVRMDGLKMDCGKATHASRFPDLAGNGMNG
jgi:hypothetical protein